MASFDIETGIKDIDLMLYSSTHPTLVITVNDGAASKQKVRITLCGTDMEQIRALFSRFAEDMKPQPHGLSCATAHFSTEEAS